MRSRRIPLSLPNTGSIHRKRNSYYMRGILLVALGIFLLLQLHAFNYTESHDPIFSESGNDSADAILSMVPSVLHKFLTPRSRNHTTLASSLHNNGTSSGHSFSALTEGYRPPNASEMRRQIARYNEMQQILNEDTFGPLQNDSVIIVVQVHTRITYLRHLIVSLAQARDISKTLLIFSHDYYDEDINDLVQTIDFCKVMQIFYPHSIQTHLRVFPGVDPNDCPRDIKKDLAIMRRCNNALYPDLYGHYREAKFTQTKHHWWWKANRVFNQLEVTRYHTGLVLFLEEDHYVAEDFLYLLDMMQKRTADLCPQCNILSLGTYLRTFNYYTYNSKSNKKPFGSQYGSSMITTNNLLGFNRNRRLASHASSPSSSSSLSSSSSSLAAATSLSSSLHLNNIRRIQFNEQRSYKSTNNDNDNGNTKKSYGRRDGEGEFVGDLINTSGTASHTTHHKAQQPSQQQLQHKGRHVATVTTPTPSTSTVAGATTGTASANDKSAAQQTWSYHVLPSLYSVYQKILYRHSRNPMTAYPNNNTKFREVEVMPWISSKHNMGFAFNQSTWQSIRKCAQHFCSYDDYNWDWSLQHVSQQCLQRKLHAMIVKGPRVFHIGECGVHHKKKNCESNQVISKVQQVLRIARHAGQMYPRSLTLTAASIVKKSKLRKGNGGWGDSRDHQLCLNITLTTR